jgi:hypothetical protein
MFYSFAKSFTIPLFGHFAISQHVSFGLFCKREENQQTFCKILHALLLLESEIKRFIKNPCPVV